MAARARVGRVFASCGSSFGSSGTTSTIFDACSSLLLDLRLFAAERLELLLRRRLRRRLVDVSRTASSHASSGIAEIAACAARRSIAFAPSSDATAAAGAASAIPIRACAEGIWGVRCGNVGCEMWEWGWGMWREMPMRALTGFCVSSSDWSRRTPPRVPVLCLYEGRRGVVTPGSWGGTRWRVLRHADGW